MTPGYGIRIAPVIRQLMELGFIIRDSQVSFKKLDENAFQFVGKDPIPEDAFVPINHLE